MLSIVIPVFNGENTIKELIKRIRTVLKESADSWEILFIDDCSTDSSLAVIKKAAEEHFNIGWISFDDNCGQQIAVLCGLRESRGELVITMDDDLEHPEVMIEVLITELERGFDAVYAVPEKAGLPGRRPGGSLRDLFFILFLKKPAGLRIGSFRIFTRSAVDSIAEALQPFVYISAELFLRGFRASSITYSPAKPSGLMKQSRYSLRGRIKLYFNLMRWYMPVFGARARSAAAVSPQPQYTIAERGGCL